MQFFVSYEGTIGIWHRVSDGDNLLFTYNKMRSMKRRFPERQFKIKRQPRERADRSAMRRIP